MIVGVSEAKTVHEIAHCIANDYAYGTQASFYEQVERINEAIEQAIKLRTIEVQNV